jgi:hypothetical protein
MIGLRKGGEAPVSQQKGNDRRDVEVSSRRMLRREQMITREENEKKQTEKGRR